MLFLKNGPVLFALLILFLLLPVSYADVPFGKLEAILYITRQPEPAEIARRNTRAKYEPAVGCYLGAFIDYDPKLENPVFDQNRTEHHSPAGFETIVGKSHAMYFFYLGYGRPLPMDWVRYLARQNKFVHIALEPNNGLKYVKDDRYLQKLADDMARSGAKIFLRFASEMNGAWVIYSKDPAEYRRKYRLIYSVMRRRAPNVALVWCPYTFPRWNINDYYPGDDATDWVGVNMYSVTYHNNSRNSPSESEHTSDLLSPIYNKYAAKKPFMICEFAATHNSAVEGRPRPDFAMRKILTLYSSLPRRFPRVKCINYFDSNNMQFIADRAYNDYSVTNDATVKAAYSYSISHPYFLPAPLPEPQLPPPPVPMPLRKGEILKGTVRLSCWARTPSDFVKIRLRLDGRMIYEAERPDLWECLWNAGSAAPGRHNLTLEVLRPGKNNVVARQSLSVITAR